MLQWAKIAALGAFSATALICAILGIQVLAQDSTAKAGIATLTFNLADIHLPNLVKPRVIPVSIPQSKAHSAASVLISVLTTIPAATSKIQSAVGTVETAASDAIEALIPRNCSLGTKQFCVGFSNGTN